MEKINEVVDVKANEVCENLEQSRANICNSVKSSVAKGFAMGVGATVAAAGAVVGVKRLIEKDHKRHKDERNAKKLAKIMKESPSLFEDIDIEEE